MGGKVGRTQQILVQEARDISVNFTGYRFSLADSEAWLQHLHEKGYVVVAQALSNSEVSRAKEMLAQDLSESIGQSFSLEDPASWKDLKIRRSGLVSGSAVQLAGSWYVRSCTGVKEAFSTIWKTSDLIVSMDAILVWRPWWLDASWEPKTEGLHLDQNPWDKPNLECVQGMVPLLPVTEITGGLQVVPLSHTPEAKEALKQEFPRLKGKGDWCPLNRDDPSAVLLLCEPGDLILWDSRTVHGGLVGTGEAPAVETSAAGLARLSITVSMTPRAWASAKVQKARREGFAKGLNFNHCPHEAGTSTGTLQGRVNKNYTPIKLTAEQRKLL